MSFAQSRSIAAATLRASITAASIEVIVGPHPTCRTWHTYAEVTRPKSAKSAISKVASRPEGSITGSPPSAGSTRSKSSWTKAPQVKPSFRHPHVRPQLTRADRALLARLVGCYRGGRGAGLRL
jgi:hypothetical protein